MMKNKHKIIIKLFGIILIILAFYSCNITSNVIPRAENKSVPTSFKQSTDTINSADLKWQEFFKDKDLDTLINLALANNQELNIIMQEINIANNEVRTRKGAYLPSVSAGAVAGVDKVGKYTSQGASDANTDITPGRRVPEALPNIMLGLNATWEVDIWRKLRNAKKSAVSRYLGSIEGKNFMVTQLVAEIASSYYELMALDNQLLILRQNIVLYQNSLEIVRLEKDAARVTQLAVKRFEAEVLKNQSLQYYLSQQITEVENRINFLVGRFPQNVVRNSDAFTDLISDTVRVGVPSQLLQNRPDIRQVEFELAATKLDVNATRANFYPSLMLTSGAGFGAFNPLLLLKSPESLLFSIAGGLVAPLVNRNAIKAIYYTANSKQIQAVFNYEKAILKAHVEVVNQLNNIDNLKKSYDLKVLQVTALTESIEISTVLFRSARADYMEVLLTQRDALESRIELIETKKLQLIARVNMYKALGGGWN